MNVCNSTNAQRCRSAYYKQRESAERRIQMVTIAFFNQKGGVGKSTSAANLSVIFAEKYKKRVLAIDCDAQANLSYYLTRNFDGNPAFAEELNKLSETDTAENDTAEMSAPDNSNADISSENNSEDFTSLENLIEPVTFEKHYKRFYPKLSILRSSDNVDYINTNDATILKRFLTSVSDRYDICVLDCSPQKTAMNILAISAADCVVVPMDPQMVSLRGLSLVNDFIETANSMSGGNTYILGVYLSMFDNRATLHNQVKEAFDENFGDLMFKTKIIRSRALEESYSLAMPLWYYARLNPVTSCYEQLAKEIINRLRKNGAEI